MFSRLLPILGPTPRWWMAIWLVPTVTAVGLALAMEYSSLDRLALQPFFDAQTNGFPLRRDWLFDQVFHILGKWVAVATGVGAIVIGVGGWIFERLRPWRWSFIYLALCAGLTTGTVALLKAVTNRFPPWSMLEFGGKLPHTALFEGTPEPFIGGRGFPAGHASGIIAWVSLWFVARSWGVRGPIEWLFPVVTGGLLFGWTQHARGAHFPRTTCGP